MEAWMVSRICGGKLGVVYWESRACWQGDGVGGAGGCDESGLGRVRLQCSCEWNRGSRESCGSCWWSECVGNGERLLGKRGGLFFVRICCQ